MNTETFDIFIVTWQQACNESRQIRQAVFIDEQQVPKDLEWDGEDEFYNHIIARDKKNAAIGTARFNARGHIGRMAVLKPWRDHGVGSAIMQAILAQAKIQSITKLTLNAQLTAIPFYQRFEFVSQGPIFKDAGIDHRRMEKTITI